MRYGSEKVSDFPIKQKVATTTKHPQTAINFWKRNVLQFQVRLLLAFVECLKENLSQLPEVKVPLISFHGTNDGLCNVIGSQLLAEQALTEDKTLVEIQGGAHQLLLEVPEVRKKVLSDMVNWIVKRI